MAERARGRDGEDGLPGQSAYELALSNGFDGTAAKWLASLKGEPGRDGQDGIDGQDGRDGIDGQNGADGKDADVAAVLREVEHQVIVAVDRLPRAKDGQDGRDGEDGRDMALVDAVALITKDEETKFTQFVEVLAESDGALLSTITPIRDDDGYMTSARIRIAA